MDITEQAKNKQGNPIPAFQRVHLVKAKEGSTGIFKGVLTISNSIYLPKEMIGRRVRLRLELVDGKKGALEKIGLTEEDLWTFEDIVKAKVFSSAHKWVHIERVKEELNK